MDEDTIKQRLIKVAEEINSKLDTHGYRCYRVKIDKTPFGEKVTSISIKYNTPKEILKRKIYEHYMIWATS